MSTNTLNYAKDSGFQSSFLQTMPYQIVDTREIPLNRSTFRGRLPKVPLQPPRLINPVISSRNQLFTQTQLPNTKVVPRVYQPQAITQLLRTNQAKVIPSSQIQFSQTVVPSYPISQQTRNVLPVASSNVPITTDVRASSSNNISKSVEESEIEYPPEQIQTVQEVVERKIIFRPSIENKSLFVKEVNTLPNSQNQAIYNEEQIKVTPSNIINGNLINSNSSGQSNDETCTIREVIQKTVKIQPSPITKVYKKEIIERKIPISQHATSEHKITYSNAEVVSQEIIREMKPEMKQHVIMTQVPRQVVIPVKKQIPGSPEKHIVFGQERIVISPKVKASVSPINIRTGVITQNNAYQIARPTQIVQFNRGGINASPINEQNVNPISNNQVSTANKIALPLPTFQSPIFVPTSVRKF